MKQQETNLQKLKAVLGDINITDKEMKTLEWLASWEETSVINLCTLVAKAKSAEFKSGIFAEVARVSDNETSIAVVFRGNEFVIKKAFVRIIRALHNNVFTTSKMLSLISEGLEVSND